MRLRPCAKCQQKLPREKFYTREWVRPYGHTLTCKECENQKKQPKPLTDAS